MKTGLKIVLILICASIGLGYWIWNFSIPQNALKTKAVLWIKPNDTSDSLITQLHNLYPNIPDFVLHYNIRLTLKNRTLIPGKYNIRGIKKLKTIVSLIVSGKQEFVTVHINSQITHPEDICRYLDAKLFYKVADFRKMFSSTLLKSTLGRDSTNYFFCMIPKTYKLPWTIRPEILADSMVYHYKKFWNSKRLNAAQKLNLSSSEIITLASIVQSESSVYSERQKIARVYLNRIQAQMPLQADPTLVFANRLQGVKRLLNSDKTIDSPYNTYKYKGLPPGPIALTYTTAIESVLHCDTNAFLFFCARAERDGFSNFSKTYTEHLRNAKTYQASLNHNKIFR
jgi:UPF0755 protein